MAKPAPLQLRPFAKRYAPLQIGDEKMVRENQKLAVNIVPYDSHAPEIFQSVKQSSSNIIPYEIEIEHVGSTAVVGLGGKGVIDILIIAKREYISKIIELLKANGYKHNPQG